MIIYNPNDHGVTITITMPDNSGFDLESFIEEIRKESLIYTADTDIAMGSDRISDPIIKVKLS